MSDLSIARRYARALSEEAASAGKTEEVDADIALVRDSLDASRDLVRVFASPVIPREKKKAVITSLFESRIEPLTLRFMHLLVEKNREAILPMVTRSYQELRDEETGTVEARARVATKLSSGEESDMRARLERLTGSTVRLDVDVDPSILGGAIVRVGDTVYDGSVRNKLGALHAKMRQGSFNQN
jgi:F-type H+-transporting ATPase subunit delta